MLDAVDADAIRAWVEAETEGRVTRFERVARGASRATWLVDVERAGSPRVEAVVRHDTGDGPLSGTELDLAREAVVYRALRHTAVRIPHLLAASPDGSALLIERAAGSDAYSALADPRARQEVALDYFAALAELHGVDAEKLDLPGWARPRSAADHARLEVALWRRVLRARVPEADPLLALAFDWLDASPPAAAERTALCHGDAGPGNFLFEGERVTALLDWEFAHLGDPLDDLAWVAVRAQLLGGFGDLGAGFRRWSQRSGLRVELPRVECFRALVLARMATACRVGLAHAGARAMDTTVYELLLPYLRWLLPQALVRAGCRDAALRGLEAEAAGGIERSPLLRAVAAPLAALPAP
jgi:aminoglycoside phosphotransferase (APT) family kinase protein